jgi:Zinc finger, C2H2 type
VGDAGPDHIAPQLISPALSPDPVAQTEAHNPFYACSYCGKDHRGMKDLERHLSTNLPHWIRCTIPGCFRTFRRPEDLNDHMRIHPNVGLPVPEDYRIYDQRELLDQMVAGTLTNEQAADNAWSMVEEWLEQQDVTDDVAKKVRNSVWSSRRHFCNARN